MKRPRKIYNFLDASNWKENFSVGLGNQVSSFRVSLKIKDCPEQSNKIINFINFLQLIEAIFRNGIAVKRNQVALKATQESSYRIQIPFAIAANESVQLQAFPE